MNKVEKFLRSDSWKHFTNGFLMMAVLVLGFAHLLIKIPLLVQLLIPVIVAIGWEIMGKKQKNIEIDYKDILWTVAGGYGAIILML